MPPRIRNLPDQRSSSQILPEKVPGASAATKTDGPKACCPGVCPGPLTKVHRAYLAGALPEALMAKIDRHLLVCRRCENTWDALTSALEDGPMSRDRTPAGGESAESSSGDCPWGHIHLSHRRRQVFRFHHRFTHRFDAIPRSSLSSQPKEIRS